MDFESKINELLDSLNDHPTTRQRGHFRVRIQGPWSLMSTPNRWTLAVEPYNDYDLVEGLGVTLEDALEDAKRKTADVFSGEIVPKSVYTQSTLRA